MEEIFKQVTSTIASTVEGAAAVIIALGAIEAAIAVIIIFFIRRNVPEETKDTIRLRLGRWLALALEFELAADILRTAIAPTWNEIGLLAAIVVLRTVINYFLQKEIEKTAIRNNGNTGPDMDTSQKPLLPWWSQHSIAPAPRPGNNSGQAANDR